MTTTTMSPEQIVDLRRRVLAGEDVSDDELRQALTTLALTRASASATSAAKTAKTPVVKIDLASSFAAFKQKASGSAPTDGETATS